MLNGVFGRIGLACVCLVGVASASPSVLHVDASAPAGGDGLGWSSAFVDLQEALAAARGAGGSVEEIRIAAGVYRPAGPGGDRDSSFEMVEGAALLGGFAPGGAERDPETYTTVLCGDLDGDDGPEFANRTDNARRVVRGYGLAAPLVLDGLPVRGGFLDEHAIGGAGVSVSGAGLVLRNVVVRDNMMWFDRTTLEYWHGGGGVCVAADGDADRYVEIRDSLFEDNVVDGLVHGYGGGLYVPVDSNSAVNMEISDSVFRRNRANARFVMIPSGTDRLNTGARGGAFSVYQYDWWSNRAQIDVRVVNSNFEMNESRNVGAAMGGAMHVAQSYLPHRSHPDNVLYVEVRNCAFEDNASWLPEWPADARSRYGGGAIAVHGQYPSGLDASAELRVLDSTFDRNRCAVSSGADGMRGAGAAILLRGSADVEIQRCLFRHNQIIGRSEQSFPASQHSIIGGGAIANSWTSGLFGSFSIVDSDFIENSIELDVLPRASVVYRTLSAGGSALYLTHVPVEIFGCRFEGNRMVAGGTEDSAPYSVVGGAVVVGRSDRSRLTLCSSSFVGNRADLLSGTAKTVELGGAALFGRSLPSVEVRNTVFAQNAASVVGDIDALTFRGAVELRGGDITIRESDFVGNGGSVTIVGGPRDERSMDVLGGGLAITGNIEIDRCALGENSIELVSDDGAIGGGGGAIAVGDPAGGTTESRLMATNLLVRGNQAPRGGAIWISDTTAAASLVNVTVVENVATHSGSGGVMLGEAAPQTASIHNTILWGNAGTEGSVERQQLMADDDFTELERCIVEGWTGTLYAGTGVHGDDPRFVDPGAGDYRLAPGSPAIDAGDNTLVPAGMMEDLVGNPRFMNDPFTETTGVGGSAVVDLGAYEHRPSCDADFAQPYGVLDIFDVLEFLMLFEAGGPEADLAPPFGVFDIFDMLEFLAQFEAGCG